MPGGASRKRRALLVSLEPTWEADGIGVELGRPHCRLSVGHGLVAHDVQIDDSCAAALGVDEVRMIGKLLGRTKCYLGRHKRRKTSVKVDHQGDYVAKCEFCGIPMRKDFYHGWHVLKQPHDGT